MGSEYLIGLTNHTRPVFEYQIVRRGISPEALKRRNTMPLTRRQFQLTILAVTAGYLTPQFVDKALAYIDSTGEAFLNKPAETQ